MKILAIETSCDETAAALLEIKDGQFNVLSNVVWSQTEIHQKYGGVVPEVAARQHVEAINLVIEEALTANNNQQETINIYPPKLKERRGKKDTSRKDHVVKPDLIAVTKGPGLITSLAVGVQAAKTLSYVWGVPLIGVNHLEGHLWSFLLNNNQQETINKKDTRVKFQISNLLPAVALIVSGGHTELIFVKGIGRYKLIGQTLDDAVGEAFDKVAKMLNLGYPGGPIVAHFAKEGNADAIKFPRPMITSDDFDFSFSGLKTAVKYHLQNMTQTGGLSQSYINDICASFQQAVIDVLVAKTMRAAEKFKAKSVILGGGVSANEELAQNLKLKTQSLKIDCFIPEGRYTGDNAAMIALAGYFSQEKSFPDTWQTLNPEANLRLA